MSANEFMRAVGLSEARRIAAEASADAQQRRADLAAADAELTCPPEAAAAAHAAYVAYWGTRVNRSTGRGVTFVGGTPEEAMAAAIEAAIPHLDAPDCPGGCGCAVHNAGGPTVTEADGVVTISWPSGRRGSFTVHPDVFVGWVDQLNAGRRSLAEMTAERDDLSEALTAMQRLYDALAADRALLTAERDALLERVDVDAWDRLTTERDHWQAIAWAATAEKTVAAPKTRPEDEEHGCQHPIADHGRDGCLNGWEYGPDGIAVVDGCQCRYRGPKEYEL